MIFQKIFDYFPPPKFLDLPFAGVSISDSHIRCMKFNKKSGGLSIEKYIEVDIPQGTVVSGQIINKEVLVQVLQKLKKDLCLEYVKVSLPEEKAYLFTTKLPRVKMSEVQSAIESKMEENVPVSPSELLFDYKLIDHKTKEHLDVVVSAFPITFIDTYVSLAQSASLILLSLEIESQAMLRALLSENNQATVLLAHFGKEKVGLYVVSRRVVRFTSTIPLKEERQEIPLFLSQEIKKLYMYWHTLKENVDVPERKIVQIIVCGENYGVEMVPFISAHNDTQVVLGNVWTNVFDINKVVPELSFNDSLRYATAVGLALPADVLI